MPQAKSSAADPLRTRRGLLAGTRDIERPTPSVFRPGWEAATRGRRLFFWLVVALAASGAVDATDDSEEPRTAIEPVASLVNIGPVNSIAGPNPHPAMSPLFQERFQEKVSCAYGLALQHIDEYSTCQAMFARLGSDGLDALKDTLYIPPSGTSESRICGNTTLAFTQVGSPVTVLCDRFGRVSDDRAAVILIHEALHAAGLDERPHDATAMTAVEIPRMIVRACGFHTLLKR